MTRKEALQFIRNELVHTVQRPDFEAQILEVVEKLGMLPPPKSMFIEYNDKQSLKAVTEVMKSLTWENDNEKQ